MNEKEFAEKLKPWLERSAESVGEMQATRLRAARLRALDSWREPVSMLGLVTVSGGTLTTIKYSIVQRALLWIPIIALIGTLAVQTLTQEPDLGELDAQLLTGELPIDAFLDKDFDSWLRNASGSF
jgi:hypothetical protein